MKRVGLAGRISSMPDDRADLEGARVAICYVILMSGPPGANRAQQDVAANHDHERDAYEPEPVETPGWSARL